MTYGGILCLFWYANQGPGIAFIDTIYAVYVSVRVSIIFNIVSMYNSRPVVHYYMVLTRRAASKF